MMTSQLEDVAARGAEPVALLWASEHAIYGRYGYGETLSRLRLSGPTRSLTFAPYVDFGDGSVGEVEREEFLPVASRLREGWLADRPGALIRSAAWWEVRLHDPEAWRQGASAYRFALHFGSDGQPDGYAYFRVKEDGPHDGAEVTVVDLDAATPSAYAALWRFLLEPRPGPLLPPGRRPGRRAAAAAGRRSAGDHHRDHRWHVRPDRRRAGRAQRPPLRGRGRPGAGGDGQPAGAERRGVPAARRTRRAPR